MTPRSPSAAGLVAGLGLLVVALYVIVGWARPSELGNPQARDAYYNQLVDGFRAGHLHLVRPPPAGLVALADPYDPEANAEYRGFMYVTPDRVHDLSYRDGRLYLYFGITPALLAFGPYAVLSGGYLEHAQAAVLFAAAGFLLGAWLLHAAWRRYFAAAGAGVLAAAVLAFGLGSGLPVVLNRPDVWEVPILCGFALVMLAAIALWQAMHQPARRIRWMLLAGAAYGLALGARPSLLPGAGLVFLPLLLLRRDPGAPGEGPAPGWRGRLRPLLAAVVPLGAAGLGLLLYNHLRFGSPFEFGQQFQLAGDRQDRGHFNLAYLWFNLRAYLVAPAGLEATFPFVQDIALPERPAGYGSIESPFGVLVNMPFACLALALPWAWRRGWLPGGSGPMVAALAGYAGPMVLLLGLFYGMSNRYQLEFAPVLMLLAGFAAMAVAAGAAGRAARTGRVAAVALAAVAVGFNVLAAAKYRAQHDTLRGQALLADDRVEQAVPALEAAVRLGPGLVQARMSLAIAYAAAGRGTEASAQVAEAVRRHAGLADQIYRAYTPVLMQLRREEDVAVILDATLRLHPRVAGLHNDRGAVLARLGRSADAQQAFEEALRLEPNNPDTLANLGALALRSGRLTEARGFLERALRVNPQHAHARELLRQVP